VFGLAKEKRGRVLWVFLGLGLGVLVLLSGVERYFAGRWRKAMELVQGVCEYGMR
jgi:hypothetical protein